VLVVADAVAPADALYVFPGGIPGRAECAARLFDQGIADMIVVTGERIRPELEAIGLPLTDADLNARILSREGVPGNAISVLREGTSTWEDGQALRRWSQQHQGIRRLVAVTSPHHSRRARRVLRSLFRDSGVEVAMHPCPATIASHWWRDETTLLRVTNEYIKLAYYAIAY
jgi:uncharacterized SAM-binding protein YcdF (DUF218 family)